MVKIPGTSKVVRKLLPTQKGVRFKKKYNVVGDDSIDPESGVSKQITEQVGTRGEKVSTGAGTRARSFPEEQTTKRNRKFRKGVVDLESKVNDGTATKAEKAKYKRKIDKDDEDMESKKRSCVATES